jgi:hypothetical protein
VSSRSTNPSDPEGQILANTYAYSAAVRLDQI